MPLLSEFKESKLIKVFVMGDPGTGKTIGAASFPGPMKFYDFDSKISSAYSFLKGKDPKKLEQIDYELCAPTDAKGTSYTKMDLSLEKIINDYKATGKLEYKTLVIDSATIMAEEMLAWLLEFETGIQRNSKVKSRKMASQQDYGLFAPTFAAFLFEILALPWNVVMTGHIQIKQDEKTSEIFRVATIPGRMAKQIGVYFPEVYRSHVVNGKYMVQTKADIYYGCRSQLVNVPNPVEFNYNELIKYTV